MLLMHQAEGFRERGLAVSLSYNPTPSTPLGLTARVAPSWGGEAASGAEALWGRETMAGMAHGGVADGTRLDAELGYGLPHLRTTSNGHLRSGVARPRCRVCWRSSPFSSQRAASTRRLPTP